MMYDDVLKLVVKERKKRMEDLKKIYLTLYNLFMFCGFLYVTLIICIKYLRDGPEFFPYVYESVGSVMCCLQLLQFLEVLHPIFGYVKGGPLMPFLQICGRCFVLILMLEYEPRLQKMPVVFTLFLVWCSIEIIRYPYYVSQIYKKENGLLTWIRYSAWIILYPLGFICEGIVVFRNLIFVDQSNKWSVALPNPLNFTFHFATFLRIYMLFIMIPAMYTLMSHMSKARKQKLGTKNIRKVKKT